VLDNSLLEGALDPADVYGSGLTMGVTSLSLLALGRAAGDARLHAIGEELSMSMLLTWSAVWALKLPINAERPNGGNYSFPSGHTATAFAAAPVLGKHFGPRVGYAAYAMAILTGLARMEEKKHYLADVLAGAAIGLVVSREVTGQTGLSWSIAPAPSGMGVAVRF
jgi:membrane-associated phospholipid phosphatase